MIDTTLIYIGTQLLELGPKTVFALTYQAGNLIEVNKPSVSHSNSFKVPKSKNNIRVFEYADMLNSNTTVPYRKNTAYVVRNNQIIIRGYAILADSGEEFNISIYDTLGDAFTLMRGKLLSQLDWLDAPTTWNLAAIDAKRNSGGFLVSPVINYGQINQVGAPNIGLATNYPPSFYAREIFQRILDETGFTWNLTASIDFYNDVDFSKMVLAYSRPTFPTSPFKYNQILPDTFQSDFIADITARFCLRFTSTVNSTTVKRLEDILKAKTFAVDWSGKRSPEPKHIDRTKYQYGSFAKKNYFTSNEYEFNAFAAVNGTTFPGESTSVDIDNQILPETKDIYNTPFIPSISDFDVNSSATKIYGAWIPLWRVPATGWVAPAPPFHNDNNKLRFLLVRTRDVPTFNEVAVTYNGTARTDYLVAYWNNLGTIGKVCGWGSSGYTGHIANNYGEFTRILQRVKLVNRFYRLTDNDFQNIDFTRLVYDSGDYFLLNKIPNYLPGKVAQVEMLKV